MNRIIRYIASLQFVFMPEYWFMQYPYRKDIDEDINHLLDKGETIDIYPSITEIVGLGNYVIWVERFPNVVVREKTCLRGSRALRGRPSRLTIKRIHKAKKKEEQIRAEMVEEIYLMYLESELRKSE